MTITQSETLKHVQQEKGFRNFDENFDLNVTAQELEQQPDLQRELLESCYSQYSALFGTMEKHLNNRSVEAKQQGEQVPQTKTFEGCVDHLLILAQSAEIVAQSEDSVVVMYTNNQNKDICNDLVDHMSQQCASTIAVDDQECSQEQLDRLSPVSHVSSQQCEFAHEVTSPRLTHIRKLARCKYLILDQERAKANHCKDLQGKIIRLNQIKHLARCKSKNDLSPQMITGPRNEQPNGGILRLSKIKHQARSKGKSIVKEGTEERRDESLHCNGFKDSYPSFEGMPAHNFYRGASQSSVAVILNNENLKEHQRTARRLRAFKTKKLRQQLRMKCKRNYANTRLHAMTSLTGSTSMTNSQWLSNSATLLKDDLISCPQELRETSACTEKLRANFSAEKFQGYLRSNESSALKFKSLQHIPNRIPAQNNILSVTGLPNNILLQCDKHMGWMQCINHMPLKEYHPVAARQHRADNIEEKRPLKDKQINSKYPATEANSEAQKEFIAVKRLRLTKLRREVRCGNQYSAMQGPVGN